jgi:hypothetical protein
MVPPPANPSLADGPEMPNPRLAWSLKGHAKLTFPMGPHCRGVRSPTAPELDRREKPARFGKDCSPRPGSCSAAL